MHKVANYRRAVWLAHEVDDTLEILMRGFLDQCPNVEATKFEYSPDIDVQITERSTIGRGLGCYFTLYAEGRPAATVENGGSHVNRRHAPAGEEFLKTGVYLVIEGNHIGYVADGHTNDGQISRLFHKFMRQNGAEPDQTQFQLMARADRREIERLLRVGVKSIDLGISAFNAAVEEMNEQADDGAAVIDGLTDIGRGVWKIFSRDRTPEEREIATNIQAKIHLGYDGRSGSRLLPTLLASVAGEVSDNADEFKIITKHDVIITREKLIVKKEVNIEGDEVALNAPSAFQNIRHAMEEWREAGLFQR